MPRRWQGWPGGHVRTPHIRSKWVSSAPRSPDSKAPTSGSCHIPRELTWPWATAGLAFSSWHTLPSPELHLAWVTLFPLRSSWFLPWPSPTLLRPEKAAPFCSHRPHTVGNQLLLTDSLSDCLPSRTLGTLSSGTVSVFPSPCPPRNGMVFSPRLP